jgi:hypothetical protein
MRIPYTNEIDEIKHLLKMGADVVEPKDPEMESELLAFESQQKNNWENLFWLPHKLAIYALQVSPNLRKIIKASFEDLEYKQDDYLVKLFRMREKDYKDRELQLIWVGIILQSPEMPLHGICITGFHGTTMACAEQIAANPEKTLVRGPRNRDVDKVKHHEIYYGWWSKAVEYTKMQTFGNQSECQTSVIAVIAVEARETRIARDRKNSRKQRLMDVSLGMDTKPKAILIRFDNEQITLRKQDRSMTDYDQEKVDGIILRPFPTKVAESGSTLQQASVDAVMGPPGTDSEDDWAPARKRRTKTQQTQQSTQLPQVQPHQQQYPPPPPPLGHLGNFHHLQPDPEIVLKKDPEIYPHALRKKKHSRDVDVGMRILISIPSSRAGREATEYRGEYISHGQDKTAFELNCPNARFHGKVLKVATAKDMEPSVFMQLQAQFPSKRYTPRIWYNCDGVEADTRCHFHCWITDLTIPLDEYCRDNEDASKSRCSLAAFCCIVRAAEHGLYLSDNWFFNLGVDVSGNAKDHPVLIIDAGGWGINQEEPWTKGEIKKKVIYKFWKACAKESIDCSELRDMWKNAWTMNEICEKATEAWNTKPFLTNIAESSSALRPASESPLHLRGVLCTLLGPPTWQPTGSPSMSNWQPTHQTATD